MSLQRIAEAMERLAAVLRRRPALAVQDDAPAVAVWEGGLRVTAQHPGGAQVVTDMPQELGGNGDAVSPGWLVRAGAASCAVTRIVMSAAEQGVQLDTVRATMRSRSDARGLLGMRDSAGEAFFAGPTDLQIQVQITARDVPDTTLARLVEESCRCSPVNAALETALSVDVACVTPGR